MVFKLRRLSHANETTGIPRADIAHQWCANDILIWDNRCAMRQALGDFDETQLRHMERTTVLGTPSAYVVANA